MVKDAILRIKAQNCAVFRPICHHPITYGAQGFFINSFFIFPKIGYIMGCRKQIPERPLIDRKLNTKEYILLASMLFGMFFGAGNLIFPVSMGQQAGANLWPAIVGFCLTGVGLPLLGIAAMGVSRSEGLFDMCRKVGKPYAYFFTCLLYLCIGPLFAIPRTATVSFSVGILPLIPEEHAALVLCLFSAVFFAIVLFFSLRPSGIMTWIGKILNPLFLVFLGILAVTALAHPIGSITSGAPTGNYDHMSFFQGFLEGYNTLDALASPPASAWLSVWCFTSPENRKTEQLGRSNDQPNIFRIPQ